MSCAQSVMFLSGSYITPEGTIKVFDRKKLPCKSWRCPDCAPKQVKILRSRVYNGDLQNHFDLENRNTFKFLTLTCPGQKFRNRFTPQEALRIMQENWNKLITALRKRLGKIHYFRVVEPQQDNYPHYHVVLIGDNISHKSILQEIRSLWCDRYNMGFIKINSASKKIKSFNHAVNYLTKYLTKGMQSIKKYSRIFSNSRGSIMKKEKFQHDWLETKVYFGTSRDDGTILEVELTDVAQEVGPDRAQAILRALIQKNENWRKSKCV